VKENTLYLLHMLDCATKIEEYTRSGQGAFMSSTMIQDAVLRNLEILGEAAKRLDPAFRDAHQEVPWRKIAGLRDVLIHNYPGVDLQAVWLISQEDVPAVKKQLAAIVALYE
jgi:uncharacterized protein with HEPN domain